MTKFTLSAALLCDAATVREDLLHILGGGVTALVRPSFPAPLGCVMAIALAAVFEAGQASDHEIRAIGRSDDEESLRLFEFGTGFGVSADTTGFETLPLVLPLNNAGLPRAGRYVIELYLDGAPLGETRFEAFEAPAEHGADEAGGK